MTTYSQSLTVYISGNGHGGAGLLCVLYGMARKAPGALLTFIGAGRYMGKPTSSIEITIPSTPIGTTSADLAHTGIGLWDPRSEDAASQRWKAERLFVKGNVLAITCDHFSLYARASELVERFRIKTEAHCLFDDPANVWDYVAPP